MVPNDFVVVQIEDCLRDSKAMAYGILQPGNDVEDGVPMIRTVDIGTDGLSGTKIIKVSKELHEEYKRTALEGGEVLLSVMGTVGRTMVVPKSCSGWNVNRALAVMRLNENVDANYFSEYLKSPFINERLVEQAIGSAQKRINLGDLRKYKLNLPPLPEQRKIAKILFTWDNAISTTERLVDNSKQQKKALMQQLLTGKKRLLDDLGKPFEGEWEEVKLDDLGSTFTSLSGKTKSDFGSGRLYVPYINIFKNASVDINQLERVNILEDERQNEVKYGDIFFTTSSETPEEVGMSSVMLDRPNEPVYLNSFCFGFRPYSFEQATPKFMKYVLRSSSARRSISLLAQGATRYNLSKTQLLKIKIALPTKEEQKKIASVLSNTDKEIELLEQQLTDLKQEKKALMQQLLTGKRRVKVDDKQVA